MATKATSVKSNKSEVKKSVEMPQPKIELKPQKKLSFSIPIPSNISATHIVVALLIVASYLLGMLTTKLQMLEKGNSVKVAADTGTVTPAPQAAPAEDTTPRDVELDDDPVLGDKNAPVTLIEFSDYECPFCKRHFDQTYSQIKTEYIDTGKVKMVFRDLPLSFHDPLATQEAIAANCAREQGGDEMYFKYHDLLFKNTTSNGKGLTLDQLNQFASELGLNTGNFKSCLDSEKYKDEVAKDVSYGNTVGASATPTFFIGKSTDTGKILGTPLIGAYPYASFKDLIDKHLN